MVFKKSMKGILAGILIGISNLADAAEFRVYNRTSDLSVNVNNVYFKDNILTNGSYLAQMSPSLEVWNNEGGVSNSSIKVSSNSGCTYTNLFSFKGAIPSGIDNSVRFSGVTNYSSNVLFTYVNQEKSGVSVGDCRKIIVEGNGSRGDVPLSTISNAVNGQIYATNFVNITPIETSIKNFVRNADGTVKLEGKARPGTVLWPEWSTNLVDWTAMSNQAKYISVTTNNFDGFDGFSYTNLTATNNPMFFRIGCDSYNPGTSNLLANSQAQVQSVKNLEAKILSVTRPSYKVLRYWNK